MLLQLIDNEGFCRRLFGEPFIALTAYVIAPPQLEPAPAVQP